MSEKFWQHCMNILVSTVVGFVMMVLVLILKEVRGLRRDLIQEVQKIVIEEVQKVCTE